MNVRLGIFIFIVGAFVVYGLAVNRLGEEAANYVIFAWIVLFILIAVIVNLRKSKKRKMQKQKAEKAIEYAKKSAAYQTNTYKYDYSTELNSTKLSATKSKPDSETIPANVPPNSAAAFFLNMQHNNSEKESVKQSASLTNEDIIKEYSPTQDVNSKSNETEKGKNRRFVVILIGIAAALAAVPITTTLGIPPIAVVGCIAFFCFLKLRKTPKSSTANISIVYEKLVPREIARCFGEGSSYVKQNGFPLEEMQRINCFKKEPSKIEGAHYISGMYKNVSFRSAYETVKNEYTYLDDDGYRQKALRTIFRGLWVSIPYPKSSAFALGLCSNSKEEMTADNNKKKPQCKQENCIINETESVDFNTLFSIYSEDEQNLYYILTPNMMERLAALYTKAYTSQQNTDGGNFKLFDKTCDGIYLFFYKNRLYLGMNSDKSFFYFKAIESTEPEIEAMNKKISCDLDNLKRLLDIALSLL